jgi:ferredoxin-NADP reductase
MSKQYTVKVLNSRLVAANTLAVSVAKPASFKYHAGQYTIIDFNGEEKYMSLASAPYETELTMVMRLSNSAFKNYIKSLEPGDAINIKLADGILILPPDGSHHYVLLAGGIGITPFRSILRDLAHHNDTRRLTLLYSNKLSIDTAFHEEFSSLSSRLKNFNYVSNTTQEVATDHHKGRISVTSLVDTVDNIDTAAFYIAGSHHFITGMRQVLLDAGATLEQIKAEVFCGYCSDHVCCCHEVETAFSHSDHTLMQHH